MQETEMPPDKLEARARNFYGDTLDTLERAGVPFLIGGGYALAWHTSIHRQTKDLDIFLRRSDCGRALAVLAEAGYRTEIVFQHWLAKAHSSRHFIDIIFSSGNGLAAVTDTWFVHAVDAELLGKPVRLCAPEEMIWSKSFVMERERYDGADIAHLLRVKGAALDWPRLLHYFGEHWPVLLNHLILYDYIYPGEPSPVPVHVMRMLLTAWEEKTIGGRSSVRICRGPLLSRAQYLVDIEDWGYEDGRRSPHGTMSSEEIAAWTEAIPAALRHESQHKTL